MNKQKRSHLTPAQAKQKAEALEQAIKGIQNYNNGAKRETVKKCAGDFEIVRDGGQFLALLEGYIMAVITVTITNRSPEKIHVMGYGSALDAATIYSGNNFEDAAEEIADVLKHQLYIHTETRAKDLNNQIINHFRKALRHSIKNALRERIKRAGNWNFSALEMATTDIFEIINTLNEANSFLLF